MIQFLDTNDVPLSSLSAAFFAGEDSDMPLHIDCRTGYGLSALNVPADLTVKARFSGDISWTDIGAAPLDLSSFDGIRKTVEVRFTGGAIAAESLEIFSLKLLRI
jgi:hypothetical protein